VTVESSWTVGRALSLELLERDDHLAALRDLLAAVVSSRQGRLVLVRGEAGIGKTALVRRFCEEQQPPTRILLGACEGLFTPRALGPFVDIARLTGGELEELVDRGGLPHAVVSVLSGQLAKGVPTVLVLEDLHWADEATLDVLRLLGRRIDAIRALVVATYRDDELGDSHPLRVVLGELARTPAVSRLDTSRLSAGAVAQLARPYSVDAEELYRNTGGNPFFVSEVLAAGTAEIPSTVRDAVLARAAGLSSAARALLEALAVAVPPADVGVLQSLAGEAAPSLAECIGSGMVIAGVGGVAFRHELARLVIEDAMAPDRRVALHARALTALADSSDHARLAHHAEAAGDAGAVLRFAPEAAKRAAALGAHRESAAQYARALRFADALAPERQAGLHEGRSHECMLTDQIEDSINALHRAIAVRRELGDVRLEGDGLQQLSDVLWCPGRVAEARDAAQEAVAVLERLAPGRELAMAYCRLAQLCMDAEDVPETVRWGTRALELAETLGEADIIIRALNNIGTARFLNGEVAGREQLERSLALATDAGLDEDICRAMMHLAWIARRRRAYALASDCLGRALPFTTEGGFELWRAYLLGYWAQIELDLGRWQDAVDTAALVLREPRRSRVPRIVSLAVVARVRARRGDPDVWPLLDEALALAERGEELQASEPVAVARAEAAWLEGDRDGVEAATARALALATRRRATWVVSELASWRRRAGIVDQLRDDDTTGPYALEIAGDWSAAAACGQELGFCYEAALASAESENEDTVLEAIDQLGQLGARPAAAIAARRLRKRGVRGVPRGPRPATRENPAGLTARELEVLALLAEGLRNTQIAERLVVSQKTVDHHVSAILRKLDVRTRGEASAQAARLGLIAPK
jgi:DNA-binding CsgD family transcriptional regulator/tetratricopeptide (TPR) repeat protein